MVATLAAKRRAGNLDHLRQCIAAEASVAGGVRAYTGESTAAMCRRLHLDRTSVHLCLKRYFGRRYESTRRALELGLDLPTYSLDKILDGDN
jgi:hypothetical protein